MVGRVLVVAPVKRSYIACKDTRLGCRFYHADGCSRSQTGASAFLTYTCSLLYPSVSLSLLIPAWTGPCFVGLLSSNSPQEAADCLQTTANNERTAMVCSTTGEGNTMEMHTSRFGRDAKWADSCGSSRKVRSPCPERFCILACARMRIMFALWRRQGASEPSG